MSDYRAIAAVTETMRQMLQTDLDVNFPGARVTAMHPAARASSSTLGPGVNIFLYQVRPNTHLRNTVLPVSHSEKRRADRPVAALDLHYLFSFYGSEETLEEQRLLGNTVAFWNAQPVLPRAEIEAITEEGYLKGANLADQSELVRLTPLEQNLEETARLWSTLLQTSFTLSVAYRASVVLLERSPIPQEGPLVREGGVIVDANTTRRSP